MQRKWCNCGTRNAFNTFAWHVYIKDCRHELKSVYDRLFAINIQIVVNMPRSERTMIDKQFMEFERGRMSSVREDGLFFHVIAAHTRRNAITVMCVWMRWIEDNCTVTGKTPTVRTQYDVTIGQQNVIRIAVRETTVLSHSLAQC